MTITSKNADIINSADFYIHDDVLVTVAFDRAKSMLTAEMIRNAPNRPHYFIYFKNTVGLSISDCAFWGRSPYVLDFEYVTDQECKLLLQIKDQMKGLSPSKSCKLLADQSFFETRMVFVSGDTLEVICEAIEFSEHQIGG